VVHGRHRDQSQSPARLSHPRNVRGGHRVARTEVKSLRAGKGRSPTPLRAWKRTRSGSTTRTLTNTRTAICKSPAKARANCSCIDQKSGNSSPLPRSKARARAAGVFLEEREGESRAGRRQRQTGIRPARGFEAARSDREVKRATMKWSKGK